MKEYILSTIVKNRINIKYELEKNERKNLVTTNYKEVKRLILQVKYLSRRYKKI